MGKNMITRKDMINCLQSRDSVFGKIVVSGKKFLIKKKER